MTNRRTVLKSLGGMAALTLPFRVLSQQTAPITALTSTVSLINAGGANVLALTTAAGLVLVDSGPAEVNPMLMETLSVLHDNGVSTLFNTHWHPEQIGGNEVLGLQGATIIAHQKTHQRLSTDYYIPHEERYHQALPEAAWPTQFFHDRSEMNTDEEAIEYGYLVEPHTDGDIYVHFREANVLAVGDAVSPERDPELDWYGGGWLGGRVSSLDKLLEISDDNTQIVPAFGKIMSKAELQAERDLMQEVYNRVLDLIRNGCSAECMVQEGALTGLSRTWNDPGKFLYAAYKGMWAHHYNLAPNIL
jgi:cyclase